MRKVAWTAATAVVTGEFPRSMSDILIGRKGYGLVALPGSHTGKRRIIRNFCDIKFRFNFRVERNTRACVRSSLSK